MYLFISEDKKICLSKNLGSEENERCKDDLSISIAGF